MKILHIIESLEIGGAEMVVVNLSNMMSDFHKVDICCVKKRGPLVQRLNKNIEVVCLNKKEGNDIRIPFRIARIIKDGSYDVIHIHNWGCFFDSVIGARIGGSKNVVHTAHGHFLNYPKTISGTVKYGIRRALDIFAFFLIKNMIAVSSMIKDQIIKYFVVGHKKVAVIYNGVTLQSGNETKAKLRKNSNELIFVFIGRLSEVKNIGMMLMAFSEFSKKSGDNSQLWVVGDGPEKNNLESLARKLNIEDKVVFFGFQDNVEKLLIQGDVFILTSHYEGISIALLEAMTLGLPCIVTNVGGNGEVVEDGKNGIIVDDDDIIGCVKAMQNIAENYERRRDMGINAHKMVVEKFSLESSIGKYYSYYLK